MDQEEADITDPTALRAVVRDVRPQLILHAAAFTDVDRAEAEPHLAQEVNAFGTLNVVVAAADVEAQVAYVSTDYVFDGHKGAPYTEDDPPSPLNIYGQTKLAGERVVRATVPHHYIFRTAWLFAPHGRNFVNTVIRLAQERGHLRVVDDQVGTPTYTLDLAEAIRAVLRSGSPGTYHIANATPCSWYDFAEEILRQTGIPADLEPTTSEAFGRAARRPFYSALATDRLRREAGHVMRPWREALADCLRRKRGAAEAALCEPLATATRS
jgi:dTDP-4-dehydrorhamnose reductase